jgi:hypothetical protein
MSNSTDMQAISAPGGAIPFTNDEVEALRKLLAKKQAAEEKLSVVERIKLDVSKIHSEISGLVSMRLWVALGVTAALGLALKDMLVLEPFTSSWAIAGEVSKLLILTSILHALLFATISLWKRIRTYSTYLRANHYSFWECDWAEFRTPETRTPGETLDQAPARHAREKWRSEFTQVDLIGFGGTFVAAGQALILLTATVVVRFFLTCINPSPSFWTAVRFRAGVDSWTVVSFWAGVVVTVLIIAYLAFLVHKYISAVRIYLFSEPTDLEKGLLERWESIFKRTRNGKSPTDRCTSRIENRSA